MTTLSEAITLFQAFGRLYAQVHLGMDEGVLPPNRAFLDSMRGARLMAEDLVKLGHTQQGYDHLQLCFHIVLRTLRGHGFNPTV